MNIKYTIKALVIFSFSLFVVYFISEIYFDSSRIDLIETKESSINDDNKASFNSQEEQTKSRMKSPLENKAIESDELNITFYKPENWSIEEEDEKIHEYLDYFCDSCKLVMINYDLSCAIVKGTPTDNDERSVGQLSLIDKDNVWHAWRFLYKEDEKIEIQNEGGNIAVHIDDLKNRSKIGLGINNDYKREYKENLGYYSLLNYNGGIVNEECVKYFDTFMLDVENYYSDYTLKNSDEGVLDFKRTFVYRDKDEVFNSHLIFNPAYNEDLNLRVSKIDSSGIGSYFVKGNKIYFLTSSAINVYDLFEDSLVSLLPESDEYITSIFLDSRNIYFSTIPSEHRGCLDMPTDYCRSKIFKMNLNGSDRKLLYSDLKSLNIIGLKDGDLYGARSFGDIGAYFMDIYKHDGSGVSLYKEYSSNNDDGTLDEFLNSLNSGTSSSLLYIKEGEISPYEVEEGKGKYIFID